MAAAGALAAGGVGWLRFRHDLAGRARGLYHHFASPPPPAAPPGRLDADVTAALAAAVEALVGEELPGERPGERPGELPGERRGHYLAPFRWRAEHRRGYLEVYRRFTRLTDAAARRQGADRFAALPLAQRRSLLATWFPAGRLRHFLTGWAAPERMLLRRHVVEAILAVYAETDAWTDLGYGGWPGQARGLASYRQAPPGAAGEGR